MMRNRSDHWFTSFKYMLALGIGLACAVGCYGTSNRDGSGETHFLRSCSRGAKCADGLECVCGVCTVRCDENDTCKEQNDLSSCMPSDCSEERTCDVECVEDEACVELGSKFRCDKGRCRIVATAPIDAGSGDTGRSIDSSTGDERQSSDTCELEDGFYHAVYEMGSGYEIGSDSCVPIFYRIPIRFHYSDVGRWNFDQIDYGLSYSTDIAYQGCELEITHRISRGDVLIFQLQGRVEVENERQLSGEVTIAEYSADQSVLCEGTDSITLTKTAELYDFVSENVSCPSGCRPITAYPITDCVDYSTDLTEAERSVACECNDRDESGWYAQCHRRLSDNSLWFFAVNELGNPDDWGDCTEEQNRAASISCDFLQCERKLWSNCPRSKMCEVQDCGGLQFDQQGCARMYCESDNDCRDDERCIMFDCPFAGYCQADRNGDCHCAAITLCTASGRCNPVASVGPRGGWQNLQIDSGVEGFCAPDDNCFQRWTITPDGQIDYDKFGVTGTATLSEEHRTTLERAIDGPELRVAMRDGIECDPPPLDVGVIVTLVLDGQTFERDVTGCVESGPEGNVFWWLFQIATSY
jgi:hypothetical protein